MIKHALTRRYTQLFVHLYGRLNGIWLGAVYTSVARPLHSKEYNDRNYVPSYKNLIQFIVFLSSQVLVSLASCFAAQSLSSDSVGFRSSLSSFARTTPSFLSDSSTPATFYDLHNYNSSCFDTSAARHFLATGICSRLCMTLTLRG